MKRRIAGAALVVAAGVVAYLFVPRPEPAVGEMALAGRGTVVLDGVESRASVGLEGTTFIAAPDGVRTALQGEDAQGLVTALREAGADALLVSTQSSNVDAYETGSVGARLTRYHYVPPLRALHVSATEVLYAHDADTSEALQYGRLLARIARGILEGRRPPPSGMLPPVIRRARPVEVMVLLRAGGEARLWRSARGSSIGRALQTAAVAARQRWGERAQALGGPLSDRLPEMDVEISLLIEDGDLASRDKALIERVFSPAHGVAYERRRAWRYLRPEATRRRGEGSAVQAYHALLNDDGRPPEALQEAQLRLYRMVQRSLGRSPAERQRSTRRLGTPEPARLPTPDP